MFKEVYLLHTNQEFAISSSPEVFQKYDVKGSAVVLFKKVNVATLVPPSGDAWEGQRFLGGSSCNKWTSLCVYQFDEGRADFVWPEDGKLSKENITSFITNNSMELIVPFHPEVLRIAASHTQAQIQIRISVCCACLECRKDLHLQLRPALPAVLQLHSGQSGLPGGRQPANRQPVQGQGTGPGSGHGEGQYELTVIPFVSMLPT